MEVLTKCETLDAVSNGFRHLVSYKGCVWYTDLWSQKLPAFVTGSAIKRLIDERGTLDRFKIFDDRGMYVEFTKMK